MILGLLRHEHYEAVANLFFQAFQEDTFYAQYLPDPHTRRELMIQYFSKPLDYCLDNDASMGLWEDGRLIGFILCFDYRKVRNNSEIMDSIFGSNRPNSPFPRMESLIKRMETIPENSLYLLSIAVDQDWRMQGLAEAMLDAVMQRFPRVHLVSDVSNSAILGMYSKRNFAIEQIEPQYYFIHYDPVVPPHTAVFGKTMHLLVPDTAFLVTAGIAFTVLRSRRYLTNCTMDVSCGVPYLIRKAGSVCPVAEIELTYQDFLQYQRIINPSQYDEMMLGDCVLYWNLLPYETEPLFNDALREIIINRQTEWSLIPDVFVAIPMRYQDTTLLKPMPDDFEASQLFKSMDFRARYELGLLVDDASVDDYSGLKKRLKRIYLGKFLLQITGEILIEHENEQVTNVGPAAYVDMFVTVDTLSGCAVLTWYSLSSPFLVSYLLDCISRRQLQILHAGKPENFFSFFSREYGLTKQGKPKTALIIPRDRTCLVPEQLASLLAGETIYQEGEAYGILNDQKIFSAASADYSLGQYNRGYLYAYTTVVVQFYPNWYASIQNRLQEESILMFYMELLLLEEAAIHIANQAMVRLLADKTMEEPVSFLDQVSQIYDEYCKTTDFWSVQANYPSSQRSLDVLRNAFQIQEQLDVLQRSQNQLESVFHVKSDRIDRQSDRKMNASLTVISFLVVFSAWIDGHDYISAWEAELGVANVHLLQRLLFFLVLLIAVFAVLYLLGDKIRGFLQKKLSIVRKILKPNTAKNVTDQNDA